MDCPIPGHASLGSIRMEADRDPGATQHAVVFIVSASGSCLQFLPWVSQRVDYKLYNEVKSFLPKLVWVTIPVTETNTEQECDYLLYSGLHIPCSFLLFSLL